jgi:hypothetical protein
VDQGSPGKLFKGPLRTAIGQFPTLHSPHIVTTISLHLEEQSSNQKIILVATELLFSTEKPSSFDYYSTGVTTYI